MALRSVVVKVDLARRMESQGRAAEVKGVAVEVVVVNVVVDVAVKPGAKAVAVAVKPGAKAVAVAVKAGAVDVKVDRAVHPRFTGLMFLHTPMTS
jgi:hypothetical protein